MEAADLDELEYAIVAVWRPPENVKRFAQHGLTCQERYIESCENTHTPRWR